MAINRTPEEWKEVLFYIDPNKITEEQWLTVAMAWSYERQSYSVLDEWSRQDTGLNKDEKPRYIEKVNRKRFDSFKRDTGKVVTGASLVDLAKSFGYSDSSAGSSSGHQSARPSLKIHPMNLTPCQMFQKYLEAAFHPEERINIVLKGTPRDGAFGKYDPAEGGKAHSVKELIDRLSVADDLEKVIGRYNHAAGCWCRINPVKGPKGSKNEDVTSFRYCLAESDKIDPQEQYRLIKELELPAAAIVFSGGHSTHALLHVDAENEEEWKERQEEFETILNQHGFAFDENNHSFSKLSRLPGAERNGQMQYLIEVDPSASWHEWKRKQEEKAARDAAPPFLLHRGDEVEARDPEWLIPGYIPKDLPSLVVGDGGVGKTTFLIDMAAAITTGRECILERNRLEKVHREPQEVMWFCAEESFPVQKKRLKAAGVDFTKFYFLDVSDENFSRIQLGSDDLRKLVAYYRPALCVFDPLQSFVEEKADLWRKNQVRAFMRSLFEMGSAYGTTFLIIVHTNKRPNASGRDRVSDSTDLWDASRSVLILGNNKKEKGQHYISHEKCNEGPKQDTILYSISNAGLNFEGITQDKDADFVAERNGAGIAISKPANAAAEFILEELKEKSWPQGDLVNYGKKNGYSANALTSAIAYLKSVHQIESKTVGNGPGQGVTRMLFYNVKDELIDYNIQ